ncbi:hypothetical protein LUZ60_011134 [Juncus effusus]|nr:hypothetical protein LUZ60_011134 [Juncus effusus]
MEIDPKNRNEDTKTNKKKKKKAVKVVYIANPLKVKASATEFRALVQELTGRDSDPSKYIAVEDTKNQIAVEETENHTAIEDTENQAINEVQYPSSSVEGACKSEENSFEMIDNYAVFSPPLMLYDPMDYGMSGFDED